MVFSFGAADCNEVPGVLKSKTADGMLLCPSLGLADVGFAMPRMSAVVIDGECVGIPAAAVSVAAGVLSVGFATPRGFAIPLEFALPLDCLS